MQLGDCVPCLHVAGELHGAVRSDAHELRSRSLAVVAQAQTTRFKLKALFILFQQSKFEAGWCFQGRVSLHCPTSPDVVDRAPKTRSPFDSPSV